MNRVTPIDARMLERFEQGYAARPELNVMSNAVSRTALPDAAFVPAAAAKLRMDFSVLVKTNNITNQKQSGRCWMFSTLNVLRQRVIAKCDLEDFSFSPTYLAFYDKLEKANLFLENILHFADQDLTDRETYTLLGNPLPGDDRVISGESGASTTGFVAEVLTNPALREMKEQLKLDENSRILCFSTEGDTDRENYRNIVWDGLFPSF